MKFFKRKRNIFLIIGIILIILIIFRCNNKTNILPVTTDAVTIGSINEYVRTDGELEPFVDISISSDITGKAIRLFVDDGDIVKKGAPLIQLDYTSYAARLDESKTTYKVAEANLAYAEFLFKNQQTLYEDSLISFSEYKTSELEYESAKAQFESAKSALNIAEDNMNKTLLTSPIDGIITAVYVEMGENVITGTMNNIGTILMTVSDNSKMLLKSDVDETSIVRIKKGNKAEIVFDAFLDTVYTGTVTKIAKRPDMTTSTEGTVFPVEILLDGKYTDLLAGMNAEVSIIIASKADVKKVPIQAIVTRNNIEGVFTINNGIAVFTPIESGIYGKESIEIQSDSINEGDQVVTGPFTSLKRIKNNDRVTNREFKGKP